MSAIETFGEVVPGLMLESVVDPDHPRPSPPARLEWSPGHHTTQRRTRERVLHPQELSSGLVQSVRFAPPSLPFGSTTKLITSLRDFLSTYARLQPEVADLLVAFALSTCLEL